MSAELTLSKLFLKHAKRLGEAPFLFLKREGEWQAVSWSEVEQKVRNITLGLMSLGVRKGDRVSPISNTKPDIAYCSLAIAAAGAVFAAIYHTNSPGECAHVINDAGTRIAFAEDRVQLEKLKAAWDGCPTLEKIIVFEMDEADADKRVMSLDQLAELGKEELKKGGGRLYEERVESIRPEDSVAIIYTSGTTGAPKGVVFSHKGIIRNMIEMQKVLPMGRDEKNIAFLPMAHALEMMDGHWRHVYFGFPAAYAGSLQTLNEDIRAVKPTFLFSPPRFFIKHYERFMKELEASGRARKRLVNWCMKAGRRYQDACGNGRKPGMSLSLMNSAASRLFFKKVKAAVGGRMKWASSGGAPINAEILDFFRCCGIPIYEGYGQTESQGMITMNRLGAWKIGTVGKPLDGVNVGFAEDGEIMLQGWTRCEGYWNRPEETEELFRDGWLHTGDLGNLDEDGFMHITGRKKELIITSTGKNVSPLNIENLLKTSPYISEAVVFGEAKTYLAALVTLDEEKTRQYAAEQGINVESFPDLVRHPAIVELISGEIDTRNRELARIEQVKKFTILEDQFRQDSGELTPTMKVKRKVVEKLHRKELAAMYEQ